ncbi:MAG: redoxin domain-containing protein [Chloroflexi bacterium]|nr:redoxin domain-containing protein [Chloroflexota bacterium]
MPVKVGEKAPEFKLPDIDKTLRGPGDYRGQNVILAFFPAVYSGVCDKEMCSFRDSLTELNQANAQVLAVTVDGMHPNKRFATEYKLNFPVLSDYKKEVIKKYGIEWPNFAGLEGFTVATRSVFVLDKGGVVRYAWVTDAQGKEPNYDEVKKAAAALK